MKKKCVEITLYGPRLITALVIWVLIVFLSTSVMGETVKATDNAMVFEGKPNFIYNGTTNHVVIGSRWPDNNGLNHSRIYLSFQNLTPREDVVLTCKTDSYILGETSIEELEGVKLYRFYRNENDEWNAVDITWNNQPIYCEEEPNGNCWNSYGGIAYDYIEYLGAPGLENIVRWNLTGQGMYLGAYEKDPYSLDLIMIQTNESATQPGDSNYIEFMGYDSADKCLLEITGNAVGNYSLVTVYVFDNYAGISNLEVSICTLDYSNCIYEFTDSNGLAEFAVPWGTYRVDSEYVIMDLSYSQIFTFDAVTETVNIHFNTVGPGSISGYVYWYNGTGAPLAIVNVTSLEDGTDYATFTESDGQFTISPITKGNYTIQAYKSGFASELSSFTCTGDDSINLNLQAGITPPDGFSYTNINITTFSDVNQLLPYATIEIFGLSGSCSLSCFLDSSCRNTFCARLVSYPIATNEYGNVTINRMPPNLPIFNEFIVYGYKAGFQDDYAVFNLDYATTNTTNVYLYLFRSQNTSITLHELNNLQNVYVRATPNIGSPQVGYTDAGGNVTFSFPAVISDLMINATINDVNYDPYNFIYPISGNPIYIAFELQNRTITSFNLEGYLFDNIGNNVSGASVELRCASCTPSGSCGYRTTDADGFYSWWSVPYRSFCLMHATPPTAAYSDVGWLSLYPKTPNTYFNMTPGLISVGGNITPGMVYVKGLVTDITTDEPILTGNFRFLINGTISGSGQFTNGYVYVENLVPGGNLSLLISSLNYESKSYLLPIGTSNYEDDRIFALNWIGGATTRPTTTLWDTPTFPTTIPTTTTTTVLFIPENITVYQMANESEYILDTIWNAGVSCIGAMLLLAPAAAAVGLFVALLFGMKVIDALMHR